MYMTEENFSQNFDENTDMFNLGLSYLIFVAAFVRGRIFETSIEYDNNNRFHFGWLVVDIFFVAYVVYIVLMAVGLFTYTITDYYWTNAILSKWCIVCKEYVPYKTRKDHYKDHNIVKYFKLAEHLAKTPPDVQNQSQKDLVNKLAAGTFKIADLS